MDHVVNLADAKARLSELVNQVEAGDSIETRRRGRTVARLSPPTSGRQPIDLAALGAHTDSMPLQAEDAGAFVRAMRDDERY